MRFWFRTMTCVGILIGAPLSAAATEGTLTVTIGGLGPGYRLPARAAFCARAGEGMTYDVSPAVQWSRGPAATRSYALLMVDPDVPADVTLIDRTGVTIAAEAPRQAVYHWVLVDMPAGRQALAEGAESNGLVPHGKPVGPTSFGVRGANAYTAFLRDVAGMAGTYGGYDGPCPPKNDARTHRYVVTVYALDVPTLGLSGAFDGVAVENAIKGHVLARGAASALYDRRGE